MKTLLRTVLAVIVIGGLAVTACNMGGGTSSPNVANTSMLESVPFADQIKTPSSAYTIALSDVSSSASMSNVSTAAATDNSSCISLVAQSGGKNYTIASNSGQYYSTVTVTVGIKNTCSSAAALSGFKINLNSLLINNQAAAINYISQSGSSGSPYLTLTSSISGNNVSYNISTPACSGSYCDWAKVPAGATYNFTLNAQLGKAITSVSLASVDTSGGSIVVPTVGDLWVNILSSNLALNVCTANAKCQLKVNIYDPTGALFRTIILNPVESPNYTMKYTGLLTGIYQVAVDTSSYPSGLGGSISYIINPSNGAVSVNSSSVSNASVTFNYTAPVATGNVVISASNVSDAASFSNLGMLSGILTNQSTNLKTSFNVSLGSSITLSNLASGTYTMQLQSFGDAAKGVYYTAVVPATIVVPNANGSVNVNISFSKVADASLNSSIFTITNVPSGQTIAFSGGANVKYNINVLSSGTSTYKFMTSETAVAVTLNPINNYTVSYSPQVITSKASFSATFTAPIIVPSSGLTTKNDQIVDSNGNVIKLKGINWFGFNNGDMLNGMWNYDGLSGDFEVTVLRLKALGFNAVRLPFTFDHINGSVQSNYSRSQLIPATSAQLITNLTNPSYSITGKTFPSLAQPSGQTYSNQYLPNSTVMNRFLYVIDFFAKNGFYVLIDNHTEDGSISDSTNWINNWKVVAANIATNLSKTSNNMVMYDIRNEPDAIGYKWDKMGPIYLSAMDVINSVTKGNNLFFIEGMGQGGINANWGDGFVTDKTLISQLGLSDPNPFFQALASKSYLNQIVLSPHVYPPTVTNATADYYGTGLYKRLSNSFGNLAKTGYCITSTNCHRFPIAIGEFGSFFKDSRDLQFMRDFASYLNVNNDAVDGIHNAIDNWFYWSYNPNSGDTGGIVADDWTTIQWNKMVFLSNGVLSGLANTNPNGIGLIPWYKK